MAGRLLEAACSIPALRWEGELLDLRLVSKGLPASQHGLEERGALQKGDSFQIQIISGIKKKYQKYASYFCHTHWVVIFLSYTLISFPFRIFFLEITKTFLWIVKIHPFHYFFTLGLSLEGSCVLRHQVDCDSCLFCLSWAQIHLKATRLHFMAGSSSWQLSQLSLIWSSSSSSSHSTFISLQAVHFDSSCGNGGGVASPLSLQRPAVDHLSSNTFAQVGLLSPKHFAH